jgi:hypothetical protein
MNGSMVGSNHSIHSIHSIYSVPTSVHSSKPMAILEKKKQILRKKRKIYKTIIQIAPCTILLFICWMIIHFQKQSILQDELLSDIVSGSGSENNAKASLFGISSQYPHQDNHHSSSSYSYHDTTTNFNIGYYHNGRNHSKIEGYPFNGLANLKDPPSIKNRTGFYWQIPRSGGTTLKHILGSCLNLVQASRTSVDYCNVEVPRLRICQTRFGNFVNADTSDNHGIQRAFELNLIPSGLVDIVVSSRFLHSLALYDLNHQARAFTVIRDPIDRTVSTFYYLRNAEWERNYNEKYKSMTLMEYIKSDDVATDWMVRWLTGKQHEPKVTEQDLEFAKEILERKFLILLTDEMGVSVDRLIRFMGWNVTEESKLCIQENVSKVGKHNKNLHPEVEVGSEEYEVMREKNRLDTKLYDYALRLFSEQWSLVPP